MSEHEWILPKTVPVTFSDVIKPRAARIQPRNNIPVDPKVDKVQNHLTMQTTGRQFIPEPSSEKQQQHRSPHKNVPHQSLLQPGRNKTQLQLNIFYYHFIFYVWLSYVTFISPASFPVRFNNRMKESILGNDDKLVYFTAQRRFDNDSEDGKKSFVINNGTEAQIVIMSDQLNNKVRSKTALKATVLNDALAFKAKLF